ncbi:DUF1989 domain-containing protein [Paraburkholderia sediminicola]|uniref:DUF1989 domain-containing protein n=1 Tax=Paraburkholderia sediminicola TaxID=458836 RepID=UPI0038B95841
MNMTSNDPDSARIRIPARSGVAVKLVKGMTIKVINTHGHQVVDTWAFNQDDIGESMSMEHSRASILKLAPKVGDALLTNRRRAILTLVEDTTPGVHDTLIAACDKHRYEQLGVVGHHDSCTDNLAAALASLGLKAQETPCPLNLFMNVPVRGNGQLEFAPPVSQAGQYVALRAEMDLIIVMSACPQDLTAVNGMRPTDAHYSIS